MKLLLILVAVLAIGGGAYWYTNQTEPVAPSEEIRVPSSEIEVPADASVVTDGTYTVIASESEVGFAGKKPLIDGYINTGSIGVSEGTITVAGEEATGQFTVDMTTLSVSATPVKPGQENALEGHLQSERWFDVATYPTAVFAITSVGPRADSEQTFTYDVTGDLTLKGQTNEVTFPAQIYQSNDRLVAMGEVAIDRTRWGITSGSSSFFDDLADNVIDDMVQLSVSLVAQKQ